MPLTERDRVESAKLMLEIFGLGLATGVSLGGGWLPANQNWARQGIWFLPAGVRSGHISGARLPFAPRSPPCVPEVLFRH